MGIQGLFKLAHKIEGGCVELLGEPLFFCEADAVFSGDGAAEGEGFGDDEVEGLVDFRHFSLVAFVG